MTARAAAGNLPRMETSTRYIGWCPVCQRDIKVRSGALVHHGYERPGKGYIIGDCPGVHHEPYEVGTGAADYYLRIYVIPNVRETSEYLNVLRSPSGPDQLAFEHYDIETRRVVRNRFNGYPETLRLTRAEADALQSRLPSWDEGRYDWARRLRIEIAQTESKLKFWRGEEDRIRGLIRDWAPQPLRTVQEEILRVTETRAERARQKQELREQRMAEALVSLQGRIDSAVRNRRPETIQHLFREGHNKLVQLSGYELKHEDVLRLVERDHVWRAFGLIQPDGSYVLNWREVHRAFEPWTREAALFPAELGGGKAKFRR